MLLSDKINFDKNERAIKKLNIITHPMRAKIIELLLEHKKLTVTEIQNKLKIFQSEASHHLILLKDQSVLKRTRAGKLSFYFVDEEYLERLLGCAMLLAETEK